MATYTLSELYTAVLEDLGVAQQGQPASAEDTAKVTQVAAQVLDELEDENLVDWDPSGAIPGDRFLPLVTAVAQMAAPKFSQPRDLVVYELAVNRLRRRASMNGSTDPVEATFF